MGHHESICGKRSLCPKFGTQFISKFPGLGHILSHQPANLQKRKKIHVCAQNARPYWWRIMRSAVLVLQSRKLRCNTRSWMRQRGFYLLGHHEHPRFLDWNTLDSGTFC